MRARSLLCTPSSDRAVNGTNATSPLPSNKQLKITRKKNYVRITIRSVQAYWIKLTRELPFHLCTFPRWSLCIWLPVGFDRCCLQAYRHIAGTVSNRPVHRVHTIPRRNRLLRSPTLSNLCVSMYISVLSNQQSYPCIRCDKTSCSSDPLKRRINGCTRENVYSEKRNNCIKEHGMSFFT